MNNIMCENDDNSNIKEFKLLNTIDAVELFEKYEEENPSPWRDEAEKARQEFVKNYTIDKIKKLSIEEYCVGKESFTSKVRYDLQGLASMGNAYPDTFGVYHSQKNDELTLSPTFRKMTDGDVNRAFEIIKDEIVKLITEFKNIGFEVIHNSKLNNMYKYKLLIIYYPNEVFPVCARNTLYKYCECVGIKANKNDEMYVGIQKLLAIKKNNYVFNHWTNAIYMSFCDYLLNSNQRIDCLNERENTEWKPLIDEYNPGLTADDYMKALSNEYIVKKKWLDVLYFMYKLGGEATCSQISDEFGNSPKHYTANANNIAKAIQKHSGCQIYDHDAYGGYWCILFYGKEVKTAEGSFKWKLRAPLKESIEKLDSEGWFDYMYKNDLNYPLNTILYGPPGTGKTYSTVLYAVAICRNESIKDLKKIPYSEVLAIYNDLKEHGRIAFTTFHQSYGYEEFIEGIKPTVNESNDISYEVENGIFKDFCEFESNEKFEYDSNTVDSELKQYQKIFNDSWDLLLKDIVDTGYYDFTKESGKTVHVEYVGLEDKFKIQKSGFITKKQTFYRWVNRNQFKANSKELSGGSKYWYKRYEAVINCLIDKYNLLEFEGDKNTEFEVKKPLNKVFIIDEINRGNISKIFGELITLIEDTKRLGCDESTEAILPYSHLPFGVPKNVYILGTMNTADRSIALMDTALRRRFSFIEMIPDSNVLRDMEINIIESDGIALDVADMLDVINERIEYLYDREHTIGHAFFTALEENLTIGKLSEIFENKVIPLLQEYFYEDYEKIQLVLGDNGKKEDEYKFILDKSVNPENVFKGDTSELDLPEKKYVIQKSAFGKIQSYKQIADNL